MLDRRDIINGARIRDEHQYPERLPPILLGQSDDAQTRQKRKTKRDKRFDAPRSVKPQSVTSVLRAGHSPPESTPAAPMAPSAADSIMPPGPSAPPDPAVSSSTAAVTSGMPRTVGITIIAQDPSMKTEGVTDNRILTAQVKVPVELLEPGPRGHRFFVVDYDATTGAAQPPVDLADDRGVFYEYFARDCTTDDQYGGSAEFRAQNVYAIAARTLSLFELHLGRRVPWGFDSHQLHLVPNAALMANAYYDREGQAVLFGYCDGAKGPVQTCLSHDVVAHEVTHAILDGLRPQYLAPGLPDQIAFHEALADLVALLSVFELPGVLREALLAGMGKAADEIRVSRRLPARAVQPNVLEDSVLWAIAEQVGKSALGERAVRYPRRMEAGAGWRTDADYDEPHRRCEIIVTAVMRTLSLMWTNRLVALTHEGFLDLDRAVEEGATAAGHLLAMMIRGIDYLPPVDVEFEDVLDGVLVADEVVSPDDFFGYRGALRDGFALFDIRSLTPNIVDHTATTTPWPTYTNLNFTSLRTDRDEVFRFIWENAELLNIDMQQRLFVSRVRVANRIGPDGLAVEEVIAEYTQELVVPAAELPAVCASHPDGRADYLVEDPDLGTPGTTSPSGLDAESRRLEAPAGVADDVEIRLCGGGTLVFDQFARLHFHVRKNLSWSNDDIVRQQKRIDHLYGPTAPPQPARTGLNPVVDVMLAEPEDQLW